MLHLRCGKVHCGIIMRAIVLFLIFTEAHISLAAQQYSIMRDQSLHYQNGKFTVIFLFNTHFKSRVCFQPMNT
ncbi:hypothetical protein V5799_005416 [Amblyomma americanum]|uniref:Uncharacterized protein n=1 Tax=Amblyomma americanum TaxID=6943 RepID=A0AAQ4DZB2_AMBAM